MIETTQENKMKEVKTYWFSSFDKAQANYNSARALGHVATIVYIHDKDEWRVRIWLSK